MAMGLFLGPIGIVLLGLCAALPIAQLIMGTQYKDNCPVDDKIPQYLIAAGSLGVVIVVLGVLKMIMTSMEVNTACCDTLIMLVNAGAFGLFIAGNVWVYRIHKTVSYDISNSTNVTDALTNVTEVITNYCDKTCYLFAFWSITGSYIFIGAFMVVGCCACLCVMCIAS